MRKALAILLLLAACGATPAQTSWPSYIGTLGRAVSESPVRAELPSDVAGLEPDDSLPPDLARWSGAWSGWACRGAVCDVKLAIRELTATGAVVTYAGTSAQQAFSDQGEARFIDGELQMPLRSGAKLVLRLRANGEMEMGLWRAEGPLIFAGLLTRGPPPYVREAEWIATPWTEQGKAVRLEMVIHRPEGKGPFPTVVLNHGSTGRGDRPDTFGITWVAPELSAFLVARGWQVLYPQRRGRGRSDGLYDEGFEPNRARYACRADLSLPGADHAVADLEVAMAAIRARPDVDPRRIVVAGVSRGGILSVVYAGKHPDQVIGVVNFVGGWLGEACNDAATVNRTLARTGAAFSGPTLWLYGDGDPFYSLRHSRSNFEAFEAAGGHGRFVPLPAPPGMDGHRIFVQPAAWGPLVDEYLRSVTASPSGN